MKIGKIKYLAPNAITSVNIIFGIVSIIFCIKAVNTDFLNAKYFVLASWLIIAATIIDGLDGKVARLTRTTSEFGIQLDSFADMVAFGVAPAILVYTKFIMGMSDVFVAFPVIFVLCGAYRLARFNCNTDGKKKICFCGLPIPSAGGMLAAYVLLMDFLSKREIVLSLKFQSETLIVLTVIGALLMVSSIEFDVFYKFFYRNFNFPIRVIITAVVVFGIIKYSGPTLLGMAIFYITEMLARALYRAITSKKEDEEETNHILK